MNTQKPVDLQNDLPDSRPATLTEKIAVALSVGTVSAGSFAAIDVTSVTSLITEAVTAATAIGIGFLGFTAGMAIYKRLRGAA